ncbi:MAG: septum formation initiator family protein [Patescibacteria group bacterium]
MKNFQQKSKFKLFMQSRLGLTLLGLFVIFFAYSVFGFMGKAEEAAKNKNLAEEKIVELQKEKERLSTDIQKLQTPEGQEEAIREKFGWTKSGEGLVVVVDDQNKDMGIKKETGFFSYIKSWFK